MLNLDMKKICISVLAAGLTALVVDMTVCTVKGKDCTKMAVLLTKIGMYYQISGGMFVSEDEAAEYNELLTKVDNFTESMKGKKSRSFTKEDRARAHSLYEEVERFYNAHCA